MDIKEKIKEDLKNALKGRDALTVSVLRMLLSAILNKEIEKRAKIAKAENGLGEQELTEKSRLLEDEIMQAISSEVKKRKEAATEYEKGGRQDLFEKETKEAEILKKYLPEELSDDDLKKIVDEAILKVGASSIKDMGSVIKEVMVQAKGRADGSKVSQLVKELLL